MRRARTRRAVLAAALALCSAPPPARAAEGQKSTRAYVPLGDIAVNLPRGDDLPAFVVVTVVIETAPGAAAAVKANALRLREAVLFALMRMARRRQLEIDTLDPLVLKDTLYQAVARVQPDGVRDVLVQRVVHN